MLHLPIFSIQMLRSCRLPCNTIINMKGVNVGCKNYNDLKYADDTALLAWNETELSELISKIYEVLTNTTGNEN